ncbi:DUF4893 domain-containing protein [Sphingomonas sp.]|uniref:DUF4893 domain-containing protein n=1 Tax=Sphingomonas sp. TaxID=28214 RepID=UPI002CFE503D|nr:DUF4893 domain-containing protein [Sphingomonas sp.]HWK35545.1 DUF4893 domain-containing protein [Sphingomonas sp.]
MRTSAILLACTLLAACGDKPLVSEHRPSPATWRAIATTADRDRLRRWRSGWVEALAQVNAADRSGDLTAEGDLFVPDHALPDPLPPAGDYRCRVFKLGSKAPATPAFTAYPAFDCRIDGEGDSRRLATRGGQQRPSGRILPDDSARAVFLGTLMLGDETVSLRYGFDGARDMAGLVERIDERRWRLTLPYPAFESVLDVIELVPAG